MMWFRRKYRYNLLRNVRIELSTGKMERKFITIYKDRNKPDLVYWEQVDYKTTHRLKAPRTCPAEQVIGALKLAF